MARGPNAVWSWDVTKPKEPKKGEHRDLCVILDLLGRYVVGWCVMPSGSAEGATDLIEQAVVTRGVAPGRLAVHADRGSSMTPNRVAELPAFSGVGRSHSRPHASNDDPSAGRSSRP